MKASKLLREIDEIINDVTAPAGNLSPEFYGNDLKIQLRDVIVDYLESSSHANNLSQEDKT